MGLLLPLHWQTVAVLLGVVASGATAVVGSVDDCAAAFVLADRLDEADGVDEVLALSGHPLGAPCGPLPALVQDYAREVPGHGDHFGGPRPLPRVEPTVDTVAGLGPDDRLLTVLDPGGPDGLAALLGALRAGAGLVLVRGDADLPALAAAERVTACAGVDLAGLPRLV